MDSSQRQMVPTSGGFSQQGSLDWVSLSRTSVSFTVDALGRYMGAGVSPLTAVVGQAIAKTLPLSPSGRRDVQSALDRLKCYQGINQALWFGFGIKSFVRALASTAEGMNLLALSAAASEIFGDDKAAEIIYDLTIELNPPESLTPSVHEWSMVARACSGVLSATKFPVQFEGLRRLLPLSDMEVRFGCPGSKDIARTLVALSRVLTREYQSITVEGGLGAWDNGDLLYSRDTGTTGASQINVQFLGHARATETSLDLIACSYQITDDLLFSGDENAFVPNTGRLQWSTCLRHCFGRPMDELLCDSPTMGVLFGCFSSLLQGAMDSNPALPRRTLYGYFKEAGGLPFIIESLRRLPELESLRDSAVKSLRVNVHAALLMFLRGFLDLYSSCGCRRCCASDGDNYLPFSGLREERGCQVILFATILMLCQTIAGVDFDPEIGLRAPGLFALYDYFSHSHFLGQGHREDIENCLHSPNSKNKVPLADLILNPEFQGETHVPSSPVTSMSKILMDQMSLPERSKLDFVVTIFTGQNRVNAGKRTSATNAVSYHGLTTFYSILTSFSTDREFCGKLVVTPGHLGCKNRIFPRNLSELQDRRESLQPTNLGNGLMKLGKDREFLIENPSNGFARGGVGSRLALLNKATLIITESPAAVKAHFLVEGSDRNKVIRLVILPRDLVHTLVEARSWTVRHGSSFRKCEDISWTRLWSDSIRSPLRALQLPSTHQPDEPQTICLAFDEEGNDYFVAGAISLVPQMLNTQGRGPGSGLDVVILDHDNCMKCTFKGIAEALSPGSGKKLCGIWSTKKPLVVTRTLP
ncbi:hypothetical protein F4677DRAFT_460588 [Hypoxylon crocopeplum]|nr:hypothetical protein F4677DRAFT_460588 [Hypoxylon crocopeplum]